jgi:hypothetical protein
MRAASGRPPARNDVWGNGVNENRVQSVHRLEPDIEDSGNKRNKDEENDHSLPAESLVLQRPRWGQEVFHHVRSIEWRNRNQIERCEREVEKDSVNQHELKNRGAGCE